MFSILSHRCAALEEELAVTEARTASAEALVVELRVEIEAGTRAEDLLRAEVKLLAVPR